MAIEAVQVPPRSNLWTPEDARQAYDLLIEGHAAKYGTYPIERKDGEDEKAARERVENRARTQGLALDRIILANHGRRFGTSVWVNEQGQVIGALVPKAPAERKPPKSKKS